MATRRMGITPACRELAQDSCKGIPRPSPRDQARGSAAMNRIKDYAGFVGWFAGLGYIVLWPLTAADLGGKPFGASIFCYDGASGLTNFLCNTAHPLELPPGLHALGFLSALFVTTRLLMHAIRRTRRAASGAASTTARIP